MLKYLQLKYCDYLRFFFKTKMKFIVTFLYELKLAVLQVSLTLTLNLNFYFIFTFPNNLLLLIRA